MLSRDKLARRFVSIGATPADALDRYLALVRFVTPAMLEAAVSRDPDDDQVLATAIAANAELIVSGDSDLLDLGRFREIPIIDAAAAVERFIGAAP